MKSAIKKRIFWALGALLVLALMAAGIWFGTARQRAIAKQVRALLAKTTTQNNFQPEEQKAVWELTQMGDAAYPELARILRMQNVSGNRFYGRAYGRTPAMIRKYLPDPDEPLFYQTRAATAVRDMGAEACRRLLGAICDALDGEPEPLIASELLRSLYWSIPESPRAVKTLERWLKKPPRGYLFGFTDADDIWRAIPERTRLLPPWMAYMDTTDDACQALAAVGTNAAFAVPVLIEVAEQGVAGKPPNYSSHSTYADYIDPRILNRRAAIDALGKTGMHSRDVVDALNKGVSDTNHIIQAHALFALAKLGESIQELMPIVLTNYPVYQSFRTAQFFEDLAKLGEKARPGAKWLEHFCDKATVEHLTPPPNGLNDAAQPAESVRQAALFALCKIELSAAQKYLMELCGILETHWGPVEILEKVKPFPAEATQKLEEILREGNRKGQIRAASVFLTHEPEHREALEILRKEIKSQKSADACFAARVFWGKTHKSAEVLPLLVTVCSQQEDRSGFDAGFDQQSAIQIVREMGKEGLPAVPALKLAMHHRNQFVRKQAGQALRKIAPEEMPPIRE
jgi:HEAT repeat protein